MHTAYCQFVCEVRDHASRLAEAGTNLGTKVESLSTPGQHSKRRLDGPRRPRIGFVEVRHGSTFGLSLTLLLDRTAVIVVAGYAQPRD
jgi:hypothetical protein